MIMTQCTFTWFGPCDLGAPPDVLHAFSGGGSAGAAGVLYAATRIFPVATETKIVKLPFEHSASHGKDLRDFFNERHTIDELLAIADATPTLTARLHDLQGAVDSLRDYEQPPGVRAENEALLATGTDAAIPYAENGAQQPRSRRARNRAFQCETGRKDSSLLGRKRIARRLSS